MIPPKAPPIISQNLPQAPLSYSQESLWFMQHLDPESIVYNLNYHYKFTGEVNHHALEKALNELVRRTEPFRTIYPNQGGIPVQVIQPFSSFSLPYMDLAHLEEGKKQRVLKEQIAQLANKPYDLQNGPLFRITLFKISSKENHFFLGIHHIGFDGWSRSIMLSELQKLYIAFVQGNEPDLPQPSIQYSDYALWQKEWLKGEVLATYISHWKEILVGELPVLALPIDKPRQEVQSYIGGRQPIDFPEDIYSRIKTFCKKEELSPFRFFLAVYCILLMRYTSQEDFIIGVPFANRPDPALSGVQGFFTNTLPVRISLAGINTVQELFNHIQNIIRDAKTWESTPFTHLFAEISPDRDVNSPSIFQVSMNFKNVHKEILPFGDELEVEFIPKEEVYSQVDIFLELEDNGSKLTASFDYNKDLFKKDTIQRMAAHYQVLVDELMNKADKQIADLQMLTPAEWKLQVLDWNDTAHDFPQVCVQDLISKQVLERPNALAVLTKQNSLTYLELEEKANQLAHHLRDNGINAESRVGVALLRSVDTIVAMLAVMKAGGAYIPLDLKNLEERTFLILEDSDPAAIITLGKFKPKLPDKYKTVCLDLEAKVIADCDKGTPTPITDNNSLIYIIYTSGSTGQPKGVMIYHKCVVNFLINYGRYNQFNPSDRVVQFTSILFDATVMEIFGPLTFGGCIYLTDETQLQNPDLVLDAIIEQKATWIDVVPTMLRAICNSAQARETKVAHLKKITTGGEAFLDSDLQLAHTIFGNSVEIISGYGPAEATVGCTYYRVPSKLPEGMQVVPIGKPIGNMRCYILDKHRNPVPIGAKGELYISGVGVGRGYWKRPELTAERFLSDPFVPGERMYRSGDIAYQLSDGNICFVGRADHQVKIRGQRVELEEIEAVLEKHPTVQQAIIVLVADKQGNQRLVGYIQSRPDRVFDKKELSLYLKGKIPNYMIPAPLIEVDSFTITPNGKVDRNDLPDPGLYNLAGSDYQAPSTPSEEELVRIWAELLKVEKVGRMDDFFELGGNSLSTIQLAARIKTYMGVSLPIKSIFQNSSLADMAFEIQLLKTTKQYGEAPIIEDKDRENYTI